MCDTIIPQQLTEITFEWFIFLRFYSYTKVFLQHNIQRIFSHTHKSKLSLHQTHVRVIILKRWNKMYNTTNIPKATKRVNISGDTPPDIWMSMLDSYGKLQKFHIRELLLQGTRKETNSARQEREVEYYKSRIEVLERFNISTKTKILKYIPSSGTWYLCGEYTDLLRSQSYLNR